MEGVRYMAVDWSGNKKPAPQRKAIRLAVVKTGRLVCLEDGNTRDQLIDLLVKEIKSGDRAFIGFDFAFSFPQWYLQQHHMDRAMDLWHLAAKEGEKWLNGQTRPFWGRPGPYQKLWMTGLKEHCQFRQTDLGQENGNPQSVFKINGVGAVGTGTIRGMPQLVRLRDAGAAIWPFDQPQPDGTTVIEIYPRLFYGLGFVHNPANRQAYLERNHADVEQHWREAMIESGDAFDAGVSALVMSANGSNLHDLHRATDPTTLLEGEIWSP